MGILKSKDLKQLTLEDLDKKLDELYKERIKHEAQVATGTTPKSPGELKNIKKNIARLHFIIGNKQKNPEEGKNK